MSRACHEKFIIILFCLFNFCCNLISFFASVHLGLNESFRYAILFLVEIYVPVASKMIYTDSIEICVVCI